MTTVSVRFRGVRGSLPCPGPTTACYGGNTSCVEIRSGHDVLILDAGTGLRSLGDDLEAEFQTAPLKAAILISHTHWDHIHGLPFFRPAFSASNKVRLVAAPGAGATVAWALHNQMAPIHFPIGLDRLAGLGQVEELASNDELAGAFRIRSCALNHPGGCAGFRIESGGVSVAYLPDHEPYCAGNVDNPELVRAHENLVEFVRGVDLLILDTQYTAAEYPHRIGWGHGCVPQSVQLAMEAKVSRLSLFHHDPSRNDDQIEEMLQTARALAIGSGLTIDAAKENETILLDPRIYVVSAFVRPPDDAAAPAGNDFSAIRRPLSALSLL
jgi:phosphoribosyl 1,2-cyclic phosphodiesterase